MFIRKENKKIKMFMKMFFILCLSNLHSIHFAQIFWITLAEVFEKKNGEKIPKCVTSLLIKAGYNSSHSLKDLNEKKVDFIETFFEENKNILNQAVVRCGSTYKCMKKFKFLPGHRDMILSIPELLPEIEAAMQRGNSKTKAKTVNKCLAKKHYKSEMAVKQQLLNGLQNVAKKHKFEMFATVLSEANLVDFEKIAGQCQCGKECNTIYRCCFVCPVCPKRYTLQYKSFWMSSNATKHINDHIRQEQSRSA